MPPTWQRTTSHVPGSASCPTTGATTPPEEGRRREPRVEPTVSSEAIFQEVCMYLDARAGALHCAAAVDAAVYEVIRVLRCCWCFHGNPQDAFEPVRSLSPTAVDLLLTYGRHRVTNDGQYVVLRAGEEELPWVGCLLMVLQEYTRPRSHTLPPPPSYTQSPFQSWNRRTILSPSTDRVSSSVGLTEPVGRIVFLNCRCFGWVDSIGSEDYECSTLRLRQLDYALKDVVLDPRYAHVGRPPPATPSPLDSAYALLSRTTVLLGNAVLMEGGLPSLAIASDSVILTCHHQYGRGLACLVPRLPPTGGGEPTPPPPLWEASVRGSPSPYVTAGLHPVSCGVRTAPGVAAQAVLISPLGPLIIHVQFMQSSAGGQHHPLVGGSPTPRSVKTPLTVPHLTTPWAVDPADRPWPTVETRRTTPSSSQHSATSSAYPLSRVASPVAEGEVAGSTLDTHLPSLLQAAAQATRTATSATLPGHCAALLMEFCEWVLQLLRATQPILIVEWHLDHETHGDMATLFHLLETYVEVAHGCHGRDGGEANAIRQLLAGFRRGPPAPSGAAADGCVRPLLHARGLEVVSETERAANAESLLSSVQYRRC